MPTDLGLVFATGWGTPLDLVSVKRQGWIPLLKRVGLDERTPLYRLRHSSVTLALASGVDVATVAAAHGHDPRMTLGRYAMPTTAMQRKAAEAVGRAIFGPPRELEVSTTTPTTPRA